MQIALAGCASIDDPDEPPLIEALARAGVAAAGLPWNGDADWSAYDLVVVRSTWDYLDDYDGYLAWADSVPRLANPAAVLRWNTDKRYLGRLAAAGVPVVPTAYGWADLPGRYVVKPTVSAGARAREERAVAEQVLAAVDEPLLYARVDLLPGPNGPVLLELELAEPYLFLGTSEGAPDRFAAAIIAACRS
ncbi:MAG: hypothetical protein LC789_11955 [Actinobacteria bacterium]|nr:hypothetical protein [Actinomycetota bacterium]